MEFSVLTGQTEQGTSENVLSLLLQERGEERHGLLAKYSMTVIAVGIMSY